jgi:hypothetical protein
MCLQCRHPGRDDFDLANYCDKHLVKEDKSKDEFIRRRVASAGGASCWLEGGRRQFLKSHF